MGSKCVVNFSRAQILSRERKDGLLTYRAVTCQCLFQFDFNSVVNKSTVLKYIYCILLTSQDWKEKQSLLQTQPFPN